MSFTPDLSIDPGLPIAAHAAEIADRLRDHQVIVVAGETGSGKTTQLPKICLGLGRRHIGHTQPRRIAARSVAHRIAEETHTPLGELVGFQIRFTATTSASTQVKVMTDGILLAEIQHDRLLRRYDTIIVDEAHERSLNIDFLLGYLKQLLPKRPDLKVIITSATIDTARFAAHFGGAPVVEVSGRTYPVEVRYAPVGEDEEPVRALVAAVASLPRAGDILVFCSGERDIKDAAKALGGARLGSEILPLFARLTMEEQARVFAPHTGQRIVLATNVAETSLTVPGVRYVVDPGFARISRYSARTKVQRLPIEPISQASANQRAGRCGRVAPGIAIRLYAEDDLLARPAYTEPEILRTNLASVILAMANARLGDIADFPFVEAPDRSHITDGLRLLAELGAITGEGRDPRLTAIGRQLAALPIDPRLGRMLLEGAGRGCLKETTIIVAGLSIQDVRERPQERREAADALHARFGSDAILGTPANAAAGGLGGRPATTPRAGGTAPARITPHTGWQKSRPNANARSSVPPDQVKPDEGGDFAGLLRLWAYVRAQQKALTSGQFRKLCHAEFLNYLRIREWQDLVAQLRELAKGLHLHPNREPAPLADVLTACLAGLLTNIGALDPGETQGPRRPGRRGPREYRGPRGTRFALSPGSLLARSTPELVMAVELVETTRLWAHTVAGITAQQVEQVGAHLLTRTYSEPFFSASTGTVQAHEAVSLLGVPLIADRRVGYAAIDAAAARTVFIQSGLVEGLAGPRPGSPYARLVQHNARIRAEVEALEDKARRRGVLADDAELFDFFDSRLPAGLVSLAHLDRWLAADPAHEAALRLTEDDLVGRDAGVSEQDFPDTWSFGPTSLGLDYRFAPGDDRDGVTVTVPLATLAALDPAPFTWGVPGTRHALVTELIRTLPKAVRTRFIPAPDWARRALDWLDTEGGDQSKPLVDELTRALQALSGEPVSGWNPAALPDHLKMGFRVTTGQRAEFSRDLGALQAGLGRQVERKLATASPRQRATGTTWVFGSIPPTVTVRDHGLTGTGYPALKDEGAAVTETLLTAEAAARDTHLKGIARLVGLALPEPYKWIVAHLANADKLALGAGPYPAVPDLLADARLAAVTELVRARDPWAIRDEVRFAALVAAVRPDQVDAVHKVVLLAAEAIRELGPVRAALAGVDPASDLAADVTAQVDNLVFPGFLHVIPPEWLKRVPVWLKGVRLRLEAARTDPRRDLARLDQLDPVQDAYAALVDTPQTTAEIDRIGYLIEEFRLQIFAQTLRTVETVSAKRILKAIADVA
ncbi:MAG: ATP-dependent RNA helicase HrpA [Propionibacteriaceae bacterium]|nr:ATP-dependent RNA helicase HrpA [Propionibacteriaceae bacterium]